MVHCVGIINTSIFSLDWTGSWGEKKKTQPETFLGRYLKGLLTVDPCLIADGNLAILFRVSMKLFAYCRKEQSLSSI